MPRQPDRQVFVSVDWLADHLNDENIRILDARYVYPDESPQGEEMYVSGHIPGATFVHWRRDLSVNTPPVPNLVLEPDAFAAKAGQLGIDDETTVVVYDIGNVIWAARIWWALRYYGHDKVYVLEGGAAAWEGAGKPMTARVIAPPVKIFTPQIRSGMRASQAEVRSAVNNSKTTIIETRRESGIVESGGTVKGAYWLPSTTVFTSKESYQSLIPEAELDRYLSNIGVTPDSHLVAT